MLDLTWTLFATSLTSYLRARQDGKTAYKGDEESDHLHLKRARTWHLYPCLPTSLPADRRYQVDSTFLDANALAYKSSCSLATIPSSLLSNTIPILSPLNTAPSSPLHNNHTFTFSICCC